MLRLEEIIPDSILYEDPLFLHREELREPATYSNILEKIVFGANKDEMNDIANKTNKTNIDVHKLPNT